MRILGSDSDAEDAVQESFVRVWRSAHRFDAKRASLTTWLFSIVRNICVDELRRRRRKVPSDSIGDTDVAGETRTEQEVERAMLGEEVRRHLAELPGEQRRAIELVYFQGLNSSEVGALLDISAGTVRSRLRLGLLKLGSMFEVGGEVKR